MEASPAVVPRTDLETRVWGEELPDSDSLRVHIHGLRAAVDDEGHGVLVAWPVVGGLDHVAMDRLAVPAGEGELLRLAQGHAAERGPVEVGEAPLPAVREGVEVRRPAEGAAVAGAQPRAAAGIVIQSRFSRTVRLTSTCG